MFLRFLDWFNDWLIREGTVPPHDHLLRLRVLAIAKQEIGKGEDPRLGNNRGSDVYRYRGADGAGAWCAAFAGYCIEHAYKEMGRALPFKRSNGAKRLFKNIRKAGTYLGRATAAVRPGDVVCWHRGKAGSWQGHIGIVSEIHDDGTFSSIEGNVGRVPAKVKEIRHDPTHERIVGFARFPP